MPLDLSPKQKIGLELLQDPTKTYILFTGGARSGKTFLITEFLVQRAFQFPGSRQLIVRKTRLSAKESIWDDSLTKYLSLFIPSEMYEMLKSELIVRFSNGSTIMIAGLDDEERGQKILGTEYITIFCNEATQLEYEMIGMLRTRLAQKVYDITGSFTAVNKMVLDCNPRQPTHWLYHWGVQFRDPQSKPMKTLIDADKHAYLHWIPQDNKKNLPPRFIEEHLDTLPEIARRRMLLGEWCGSEGAIYKEFDAAIHVIEPFKIPAYWPRHRAIDFGFNHPMAVLDAAYDYITDTFYFYREFKKSGITIEDVADYLNTLQAKTGEYFEPTWSDHAKSDRAFLAQHGIITRAAKKSVIDGIASVQKRLMIDPLTKRPKFLIFNTLQGLIDEMYAYTWYNSKSEVTDKDSPIKIDDDLVDCARYICHGQTKTNGFF